jgi:hypothetical protein
MLSDGSDNSLR